MAQVELSKREIVLIRVALISRMTKLKDRADMQDSYRESKAIAEKLWEFERTPGN